MLLRLSLVLVACVAACEEPETADEIAIADSVFRSTSDSSMAFEFRVDDRDDLLLVGSAHSFDEGGGGASLGVTYAGQNLDVLFTESNPDGIQVSLRGLLDPPSGSHSLEVTASDANPMVVMAATIIGVDIEGGFGEGRGNHGEDADPVVVLQAGRFDYVISVFASLRGSDNTSVSARGFQVTSGVSGPAKNDVAAAMVYTVSNAPVVNEMTAELATPTPWAAAASSFTQK